MHEPYIPFEVLAICHCASCKAVGQMTWRKSFYNLTCDIRLDAPDGWSYDVKSDSYLCPTCTIEADKVECESKNWPDEDEAETIIQNIFNNHSLAGF